MRTIIFFVVGVLIGFPLSYYFQPEMLQNFVSLSKYTSNIFDLMSNTRFVDLTPNISKSVGLFALIGGVIGFFADKNVNQKTKYYEKISYYNTYRINTSCCIKAF